MRILHVHKLTGVSGSENHLLALLPALRAAGVDARFLGLDVAGSDAPRFYDRLDALDVPYRRVRCGVDVSPRMAIDVVRAIRDERPDLLHTHLVHADVYGSIAAATLRIPFVSTRHNDPLSARPVPVRRPRLRAWGMHADRHLGRGEASRTPATRRAGS